MISRTEVVVATYNKPELRLVLEGLLRQSVRDFDVVVADDGAGEEIASLVREYQSLMPRLRHVWHEDLGFRKTRILNEAIRTSRADYFIFIDADCVPSPRFVEDHKDFARGGFAVAAKRVYLGPALSAKLMSGAVELDRLFWWPSFAWFTVTGRVHRPHHAWRLPMFVVNAKREVKKGLRGSNMAVWRADLERVNGFDNGFVERNAGCDSDIEWRLLAAGCRVARMSGRGCVFHLHHPKAKPCPNSIARMNAKRAAGEVWAADGLVPAADSNRIVA